MKFLKRIKPLFAWHDLWVGAYVDSKERRVFILPLPCVGVVVHYGRACRQCGEPLDKSEREYLQDTCCECERSYEAILEREIKAAAAEVAADYLKKREARQ